MKYKSRHLPPSIEGDVVDSLGAPGGDGSVLANDVGMIRQFALGNLIPVTTPNQFQRADINGGCGDGAINAGDVTVVRLMGLGTIIPMAACGPTVPVMLAPFELNPEFEPLSGKGVNMLP